MNYNINYYDSITGKNVLFVGESLRGCSTNINGYPEKLESLGLRQLDGDQNIQLIKSLKIYLEIYKMYL